jgi:hypothetical protein
MLDLYFSERYGLLLNQRSHSYTVYTGIPDTKYMHALQPPLKTKVLYETLVLINIFLEWYGPY